MFKRKKKKTGLQTPEYRKPTPPPPPTSGSNARKPNPNYIPPASVANPKATNTGRCRIIRGLIKRDVTEQYEKWNPILQLNELAVEYNNSEIIGYKLGDGVTKWCELPYVTKITDISEFWLWVDPFGRNCPYVAAKIMLDPFVINNFLGGTEE